MGMTELRVSRTRLWAIIGVPVAAAVFALALAGGCSCRKHESPAPSVSEDVVAEVGSADITVNEVVREAERCHAVDQAARDTEAFLRKMVDREVLLDTARRRGLEWDPEVRRTYENLLIGCLREKELDPLLANVTITDAEIEAAYRLDKHRYRVPPLVHVAVLRLSYHRSADGDAMVEKLQAVRDKVAAESGTRLDFGSLAIGNSDHQASRYKGGDIGWLREETGPTWLPEAIVRAAWTLRRPGDMSDVIRGDRAVFLVRLMEKRPESFRPLTSVSASIKSRLLRQKREQVEKAFLARLRQRVPIRMHPPALAKAHRRLEASAPPVENGQPPALP